MGGGGESIKMKKIYLDKKWMQLKGDFRCVEKQLDQPIERESPKASHIMFGHVLVEANSE